MPICPSSARCRRDVSQERLPLAAVGGQPADHSAVRHQVEPVGALGGFVIPPVMGVVTGMVGGTAGYARGFLPFAVLVVLALPVVGLLSRWSSRNGHGLA